MCQLELPIGIHTAVQRTIGKGRTLVDLSATAAKSHTSCYRGVQENRAQYTVGVAVQRLPQEMRYTTKLIWQVQSHKSTVSLKAHTNNLTIEPTQTKFIQKGL